jgi:hypothetical protein
MTELNNKVQSAVNKLVRVIIEEYERTNDEILLYKEAVIETISSDSILIWAVWKDKIGLMKEANRRFKQSHGNNPGKAYLRIESIPVNAKLIKKLRPAFINFDNGFENGWETVLVNTKDWIEDKNA